MPDPLVDTQWTDWDYALAEAIAAIDLLSSPTGQPRWLTEDPGVYWDVGVSVDYGVQTLAEHAKQYKEGVPHELSPYLKNPQKDGEFWGIEEWLTWSEEHEDDENIRLDRNAPEGARPPTDEEMDQMRKDREARIAAKYAEAAEADSVD